MHKIMKELHEKRVQTVIENLKKNNMDAMFVETKADALSALESLLPAGCTVGIGGSVTLEEIGALDLLRSGKYHFLDRYEPALTQEQIKDIYRRSLCSDVYVMSTNAITESGELYNVDGRSNRVAALLYGPDSVIIVAGINKIVPSIEEAIRRHKRIAAPANAARLSCSTPCVQTGECISVHGTASGSLCAGCAADSRICANYVVSAKQRERGRIKIILVGEPLGF